MFPAGEYYIGDLGFVLPSNDLRMVMSEIMTYGTLRNQSSVRELVASKQAKENLIECDYYWLCKTPSKSGSLYDQTGKSWGFDWGMFGCMPFKWVEAEGAYITNKIKFDSSFKCSVNDGVISIGHLIFTTDLNSSK